jgi:iron-siderophore transport system substrate-binding protein
MHLSPSPFRRTALLVVGVLALAACGSDDDDSGADSVAPASVASETSAPATTSAATSPDPSTTASGTGSFPVTIEHQYGETTIPEPPERVVTVGFADQDALLALGVVPVGIRDWYGEQPFATWPWATDALGGAEPTVLAATELNFEQIRALEPDLIVGISSGMTETEYDTLSAIAPTLAQSDEYIAYGVPWQEATRVIGEATGHAAEADALVADVERQIADVAAAHPEWDGLEAAVGYVLTETEIGAYASGDARAQLMEALGFVTPAEFDELAGDLFYSSFSYEEIGRLDRDVLVWISSDPAINERIRDHPLRRQLHAAAEGREIFMGQRQAGAFSFSSVLSLPYLLDTFVPQLEAAVDGDPATEVPVAD